MQDPDDEKMSGAADAGANEEDDGLAALAEAGARLLGAVHDDDALKTLCTALGSLCPFENFIVYRFHGDGRPTLIESNRGLSRMQESMSDYIKGLYTLDPFYRLNKERGSGIFRMRDIMPEDFPRSEYYRRFYKFTDVADELRYIVWPTGEDVVHIFIEREGDAGGFSPKEIGRLRAVQPFVARFVEMHFGWRARNAQPAEASVPPFDLRERVRTLQGGILTPREVDTVELMLKGHSTKSLARILDIDAGTAANHKRHIYAKLRVHSQAQLFDLFLRSLS